MSVDRLCFGTSTFAAGRLRPGIDSAPGIAALRAALAAGVRLIHSNPGLGTQWAIREALEDAGHRSDVRHLVKIEIPLDLDEEEQRRVIRYTLELSRKNLGADDLHSAVIEPDVKRTKCRPCLVDYAKVTSFYQFVAEQILKTGEASEVLAFCPSRAYLESSLRADLITGSAAQFNLVEAWPALYLDRMAEAGRTFTAMAPLRRGLLVDGTADNSLNRLQPLRWALGHPGVSLVTVTMSSPGHVAEILQAAEKPLHVSTVHVHTRSWEAAAAPAAEQEK
jgi:aryl-alcohol dehydrogenase-like predicted oxidoreductase